MAGFDRSVYEKVCQADGHRIVTSKTEEAIAPGGNLVSSFSSFCSNCGMSLDEIRAQGKKPRQPRAKKEDAATNVPTS